MDKRLWAVFLLMAGLLALAWFFLPWEQTAPVMGTTVRIQATGWRAAAGVQQALNEIKRLEQSFSRFQPSSEIALINSLAGRAPLQVSPDTFRVLELAARVKQLSHGAFDIRLGRPGGKIDLGGIGKGYAVEAARQVLLKRGIKDAIIDLHSSVAVLGRPRKIGLLNPQKPDQILGVITLRDREALSTSGQYEQSGHIIDPRTGQAATQCLSVTVIAQDAAWADALSTAAFVLGPRRALALARMTGVKIVVIDQQGKLYDNFGFKLR